MTVTHKAQEASNTDRFEKNLVVHAPLSRVWRAISTAADFGEWFQVNFQGDFTEGQTTRGNITHPGYEHLEMEVMVERIDPERYFSYRWHPNATDPEVDYSGEPTTLVEFILEEAEGGTAVKIVESGFDRIPPSRRVDAFRMNEKGWAGQLKNIARHVE